MARFRAAGLSPHTNTGSGPLLAPHCSHPGPGEGQPSPLPEDSALWTGHLQELEPGDAGGGGQLPLRQGLEAVYTGTPCLALECLWLWGGLHQLLNGHQQQDVTMLGLAGVGKGWLYRDSGQAAGGLQPGHGLGYVSKHTVAKGLREMVWVPRPCSHAAPTPGAPYVALKG